MEFFRYFLHTIVDTDMEELYILDDVNINMLQNKKYIILDDNTIFSKFLSSDIEYYLQFCTMHGFKQLIKFLIHLTCSTSTVIDYILGNFPLRVSHKAITGVGIPDHQLIFCAR